MILRYMLIGMAIGAVSELVARVLRLWLYRNAIYPVLNILLVFGVIMGGLASVNRLLGPLLTALIAGAIGLAYESANVRWLHWWSFPDERAATAAGRTAIVVLLGVLWAVVPFVTVQADARLQHTPSFTSTPSSKLDQLNEREEQLLRKVDELRRRTHDVETKLEQVRNRRQHLVDKQAHRSGRKVAAPTPTP